MELGNKSITKKMIVYRSGDWNSTKDSGYWLSFSKTINRYSNNKNIKEFILPKGFKLIETCIDGMNYADKDEVIINTSELIKFNLLNKLKTPTKKLIKNDIENKKIFDKEKIIHLTSNTFNIDFTEYINDIKIFDEKIIQLIRNYFYNNKNSIYIDEIHDLIETNNKKIPNFNKLDLVIRILKMIKEI